MSNKNNSEEEYFYKKDRELIEKRKHDEEEQAVIHEKASHIGKCSDCGSKLEEKSLADQSFKYCQNCSSIHIKSDALHSLFHHHQLKKLLTEINEEKEKAA